MMTLDEAIEHLDDVLSLPDKWDSCEECRKEHTQLRDWLDELRARRKAETIK